MKYKRIVVSRYGGTEVLQVIEDELPQPQPDEVRVKILTAGVAWGDILKREGWAGRALKPPFTPGYDIVGIVDKPGENVTTLQSGQMVAALSMVGGYAEFICLPVSEWVPVPPGADPAQAVCLVMNYVVADQMLHRTAHVKTGESVLVHSAAGGVGTALLELGRLDGLKTYGTASNSKHKLVDDLGGIPIDYKTENFVRRILQSNDGGVDAAFDPIGGTHLWQSYRTLNRTGRLVTYGAHTLAVGNKSDLISGLVVGSALKFIPDKRQVMNYSITRADYSLPQWCREDLSRLFDLLVQGKLKPIVAQHIPLIEVAHAHHLLETNAVMGKVVLVCNRHE
ncbi:MAG: medium chain dehydrogenase/reductase family protein [Chloroflexota bacterium]|nr:medium chain dehydrogenase/reductase family protein [Chloroflexota bacterium]